MDYPVTITPDDNDTFLVTFPDVPGAITYGDTIEAALAHAPAALAAMLETHIKDRDPIPAPSTRRSKYRVAVPALVEAKIRLYDAMRATKVTKAELGRRLNWHAPQVDRLLAMTHGSQLDQLEAAFSALGKRLVVSVEDADMATARHVVGQKGRKIQIVDGGSIGKIKHVNIGPEKIKYVDGGTRGEGPYVDGKVSKARTDRATHVRPRRRAQSAAR